MIPGAFFVALPRSSGSPAAAPTVSAIAPNVGDIDGGYAATITGTDFDDATGVTIGGSAATSVVVVNSTTITCVVPAHATGTASVVVTTPAGSNGANTLFEFFSPAQLSLTGWWRADYAGSPWTGEASAGASSGRELIEATDPPTAGTTVNGYAPASFNGTNNKLTLDALFADDLFGSPSTGFWFALLVRLNAPPADVGTNYLNPLLLGDTNQNIGLSGFDGGVVFFAYEAGWLDTEAACTPDEYHLIQCWYDGTNINVLVDETSGTPTALDLDAWFNIYADAMIVNLGVNASAAVFTDMDILEVMTASLDVGGTIRAKAKAYCETRYGLTL